MFENEGLISHFGPIHVLIKRGFDSFQFSPMEYGVKNYYWKEVFVSFTFLIQTIITVKNPIYWFSV